MKNDRKYCPPPPPKTAPQTKNTDKKVELQVFIVWYNVWRPIIRLYILPPGHWTCLFVCHFNSTGGIPKLSPLHYETSRTMPVSAHIAVISCVIWSCEKIQACSFFVRYGRMRHVSNEQRTSAVFSHSALKWKTFAYHIGRPTPNFESWRRCTVHINTWMIHSPQSLKVLMKSSGNGFNDEWSSCAEEASTTLMNIHDPSFLFHQPFLCGDRHLMTETDVKKGSVVTI